MSDLVVRDGQGVDRCHKIVDTVTPNNPKNPVEGFKAVKAYCNKPMVMSISEGRKICPDHDKQVPIGWVNPRVTNAAGTTLTAAELKECGLTEDPSLKPQEPAKKIRAVRKPKEAEKAVEAKVKKTRKDVVVLEIPLETLESNPDVAAFLIKRTVDAFGVLPVTNFAESERLINLKRKLSSLLEG